MRSNDMFGLTKNEHKGGKKKEKRRKNILFLVIQNN